MSDLIVYHPAHSFSENDFVFVSWFDGDFFIEDAQTDSYKLATVTGGLDIVQFTGTIYEGSVRLKDDPPGGTPEITGLTHLEAETVTVVSGGQVVATGLVSSGVIAVPEELTDYIVGILYTFKVRTTRLEAPAQPTLQSRIKRINETVVRYIRTKDGKAGQEYGNNTYLSAMGASFSNESVDATIPTKGGFTTDAYTTVTSETPFPMTILAVIVSVEVEETR